VRSTVRRINYEQTPTNESLVYHECFGTFQCAKLQVPLDWNAEEGTDNRTVEIALIKVPATVPVTDSRYGGAVVLNPGEFYRKAGLESKILLTDKPIRRSRWLWCELGIC